MAPRQPELQVQDRPIRQRLLTNPVAEFIETRPDEALGLERAELIEKPPEFVSELDRFVQREDVPSQDYFKESAGHAAQFKQTLAAFQKNVTNRKVDQRYEITLREDGDYTLTDVLAIAEAIQLKHKSSEDVNSCMGKIRKFFRATGRNASTFKKLVAFVPDDVYGSVICGGFTMILGALERMETLRVDMYEALASIPKTMRRISRLLDVHYQSVHLKHCADAVLVSIFVVLELIIRELSGSTGKKFLKSPLKGDKYGSKISEAIEALEDAVKEFEAEAELCDSARLGQIEARTSSMEASAKRTEIRVQQLTEGVSAYHDQIESQMARDREALEQKHQKLIETGQQLVDRQQKLLEHQEARNEQVQVKVYNYFYCFLASSPSFDDKTGALDDDYAKQRFLRSATPISVGLIEDGSPSPFISPGQSPIPPFADHRARNRERNLKLARKWLNDSGRPDRIAAKDLRDCFESMAPSTNLAEQDRIGFILASDEIRSWLRSSSSASLVVEIPSDPSRFYSAASYATAVLVHSLQNTTTYPVLSYFCGPRVSDHDPSLEKLWGGEGFLVSLVAQLLSFLLKKRPDTVDLSLLREKYREFQYIADDIKELLDLLEELIDRLPGGQVLYLVLDSAWRLNIDTDKQAKRALKGVLKLVEKRRKTKPGSRNSRRVAIKLCITDPTPCELVDSMDHQTLMVPESVDGGRHGININWIEEQMTTIVGDMSPSQSDGSESSDEGLVSEGFDTSDDD